MLEYSEALEKRVIDGWIPIEDKGVVMWHKIEKNLVNELSQTGLDFHESKCGLRAGGAANPEPLAPIKVCSMCEE